MCESPETWDRYGIFSVRSVTPATVPVILGRERDTDSPTDPHLSLSVGTLLTGSRDFGAVVWGTESKRTCQSFEKRQRGDPRW